MPRSENQAAAPPDVPMLLAAYMAEHRSVSFNELSRRCGSLLTAQRLHQIEQGQGPANPTDEMLRFLACALDRPYEELWRLVHEPTMPPAVAARLREGP